MSHFDVIIVGLGPTGATLAGLLGQAGISVAVFDRLPDLYPLPRAIGLDHETLRILQELGLAQRMEAHIAPYRPSEYRGMDGGLIKRLDTLPEPHPLGWAPNHVFDQPGFERLLRARLAELPTVKVFVEADVESTGQGDGQAWADVRLAGEGSATRFSARYLVACDGGSSPVRKRLGIGLEDLDFDEPWLVVDAIVTDEKLAQLPQTQVQYCEAARPSTFVVGPGNHRRWEIMLLEGDSLSPEFPEEELWPLLARWLVPGEATLWRAAAYRFHGLVAHEWRRDRILLAGDSAHMTPPFMAQGMVGGMRDAHNLAWKLARIVRGQSPATLLDSYMEERKPHMKQTILTAMALGRIICERDPQRALERDRRLREQHGGEVKTEYRQNMIPKLEFGMLAPGGELTGQLFPQPRVQGQGFAGRLDDLTGACVRVVVRGPLGAPEKAAYLDALAPVAGVLVQLGAHGATADSAFEVTELQPLIAPLLEKAGQQVVVVRPDHYVYGAAASHAEALGLLRDLKSALA
ncbi:MAG TPA: bifunctional 3-(3-hydroxy-phenyl)propionate/3-hydroxycinnamic acid hydroxylase [Burkholderiaceae bacterium]